MKIRTDFVSNSSSSSFIVMKTNSIPDIFRENSMVLSWNEYCDRYLFDELFGNMIYEYYDSYDSNAGKDVEYWSDENFRDWFNGGHSLDHCKKFLPSKFKDLACELDALKREYKKYNDLLYVNVNRDATIENGKHSGELSMQLNDKIYKDLDSIDEKIRKVLRRPYLHLKKILDPIFKKREFLKVELEDCSGKEEEGRKAISNVEWWRTKSNH